MDYERKYKMYKKKYLDLKARLQQKAGGIESYLDIFNTNFGSNWVLTGSEAIKQYLLFFNRKDLLTFEPKDVDILNVSTDKINQEFISGFKRKQTQPENSMTFIKDNLSFDITTLRGPISYYEINGFKLIQPNQMLDNYEENLEFSEKKAEDEKKIAALKVIITLVSTLERKRLPPTEDSKVNKRKYEEESNKKFKIAKLFFED